MGDYGGYSVVLDIAPLDRDEENQTLDYDYTVHIVGFFTTNEMLSKFVAFLIWALISFIQLYTMYKKPKKSKQD